MIRLSKGFLAFLVTNICRFFELLVRDVFISWHCDVNYEAGLFFAVDKHGVRPILKQMPAGLNSKGPRGSYHDHSRLLFLVLPASLYSAHIALYTIEATLLCFSV